jgi:osmotically-inducible protein OsmY
MNESEVHEADEALLLLTPDLPDDELVNRARSLLSWKIRYSSVHVEAVKGHVTLSGEVISFLDRETAAQTVAKLTGVVRITNRIVARSLRPHS